MNIKLYEIDQEIQEVIDRLLNPDLEESHREVVLAELDQLTKEKSEIIVHTALSFKQLKSFVGAMKEEKSKMEDRIRTYENRLEMLKKYIGDLIGENEKIETPQVSISWRKSESVEKDVNYDYDFLVQNFPEIFKPAGELPLDKTAAKAILKLGTGIKGIFLKKSNNIQIK